MASEKKKVVIVCLTANAGAGKTTAQHALRENFAAIPIMLAQPLKDTINGVVRIMPSLNHGEIPTHRDWDTDAFKKRVVNTVDGVTWRRFAQLMGDELKKAWHKPQIFAHKAMDTIEHIVGVTGKDTLYFCIPDVRSAEEQDALALRAASMTECNVIMKTVRIKSVGNESVDSIKSGDGSATHWSEASVGGVVSDTVVVNDFNDIDGTAKMSVALCLYVYRL